MLHGDISNRLSPIIAFNVDNLLFKESEPRKDFIGFLKNKLKSDKAKFFDRDIDKIFLKQVDRIWNRYDYSIYLVTTHKEYFKEYEEYLTEHNVVYTRLLCVQDLYDLRNWVSNQFTYYFDSDYNTLSFVSSGKAKHISWVGELLCRS